MEVAIVIFRSAINVPTLIAFSGWPGAVVILAEGAIALSVTHSGGVLFAS